MTKKIIPLISFSALMLPAITLAAQFNAGTNPDNVVNAGIPWLTQTIVAVLGLLWILFIAFAIIMFIIAGLQFLSARGEADGVGKARMSMMWGSIGVIVAILAFSLPFFIRGTILSNPNTEGGGGGGDWGGGTVQPRSVPPGGACTENIDCESNQCSNGDATTGYTCN